MTRLQLAFDPRPRRRLTKKQAKELGRKTVSVHHLWLIVRVRDEWRIAYRLVPRDGRPLVAEVRVYPLQGDLPDLKPGQWAVELLGHEAEIPGNGITAGLLKDELIPGKHIYELLPRLLQRKPRDNQVRQMLHCWLTELGYNLNARPHAPRRGPKGWSDEEYAELAAAYVERCQADTRSPVLDVAEEFGMTPNAFRAALWRARKRGLLTRTTAGRAGGELTPRAKPLLEKPMDRRRNR